MGRIMHIKFVEVREDQFLMVNAMYIWCAENCSDQWHMAGSSTRQFSFYFKNISDAFLFRKEWM
jgi:hypothetical protein